MKRIIHYIRHFIHDFLNMVMPHIPKSLRKNVLSCREVTELLLQPETLDVKTKLKLKFHLFICQCCTDYKSQVEIISHETKKVFPIDLNQAQKARAQKISESIIKKNIK